MRFRHLQESSLDKTVTQVAKTDEKTVAKAQLLHSKEWQDHVAEHHGAGDEAQLLAVATEEDDDSELLKKTEEKKEPQEERTTPAHTVEHGQASTGSKTGYLSNASGGISQKGAGDEYFGAGSARLKAISGQCSCGMEITTGWQPEKLPEPKLQTGYSTGLETAKKQEENTLYQTGLTANNPFTQDQKPMYASGASGQTSPFGTDAEQKRRRASAL